ncbi:MAG: DUF2029 domain-containing protein [Candidatus Lokiarchaeota archaeon]|nr:DUF2029 domain-containing protein [Candidatus Lokiarchaeota archaeon]MBD3342473.1 DUF2029 domain-containing protein [Candidatus Lokiarchaeota archaeon]
MKEILVVAEEEEEEELYPLHKHFIHGYIFVTALMIGIRIFAYFAPSEMWFLQEKDIDFRILLEGMSNGLFNFYDPIAISEFPPYYLYFWYFMFYPMTLIPWQIGVYIWDALRFIMASYVARAVRKAFTNFFDVLTFLSLMTIGFVIDSFYNNCNFLIVFLLCRSFLTLKQGKMWQSGIYFTLATFKINSIIFLPLLLYTRRIKLKDIRYYLIPFGILCLPYIFFPEYFLQMVGNWMYGNHMVVYNSVMLVVMIIDLVIWKAIQPSHLFFLSFFAIIFLDFVEKEERRKYYRRAIILLLAFYYVRQNIVLFILPTFFG